MVHGRSVDSKRHTYIGHFPQDGENEQNVAFFEEKNKVLLLFFEFSQMFWRDYVP